MTMKRLHIILFIATVLLSFASCSESPEYSVEGESSMISVSEEIVNAGAHSDTYLIHIHSKYNFYGSSDVDWITWSKI